ncbi:MAG: SUMF1/EgtB/PvdO family nonheme iron enzyme [Deltaproteobacteria bacterium]|nr:SUMF1/EgtB/PvdO family nonheme iron enzyme [Deltaproteobacteria bacterium]
MALKYAPPLLVTAALVCGCDGDTAAGTTAQPSAATTNKALIEAPEDDDMGTDGGGEQHKGSVAAAGERATIPAGQLVAGSTPGDKGRDPVFEPALLEAELGAFEMDRLPYPNDPQQSPLTGVSRERAAKLCAEGQGRLCTELEWERACKGPDQQPYAGGTRWDGSCGTAPETCASGFGVLAMGAAMREWTASEVLPIKKLQPQAAAIRGAGAEAAGVDHRCAHRAAIDPATEAGDLGFRCCYGKANEPVIPSPGWLAAFRKADLPPTRLEQLFAASARLAPLAKDIKYFREEAAIETIQRRGAARGTDAGAPPPNMRMTTAPTVWNPVPGEKIVLVTGRSERDSFIVAFHRLSEDRYRVGAALIMKDEIGPVVFIYNPYVRRKLHWATCWECYGATGNITYRIDNRVVITQK